MGKTSSNMASGTRPSGKWVGNLSDTSPVPRTILVPVTTSSLIHKNMLQYPGARYNGLINTSK